MAAATWEIHYIAWFGLGEMHRKSTYNAAKEVFQTKKIPTSRPYFFCHVTGNINMF